MPAMAAQQPPKKAADAPKGTGAQASAPQKKENGGLMARLRDLPQAAGIAILALLLVLFASFNTQNLIADVFFWLFPVMAVVERVLPGRQTAQET